MMSWDSRRLAAGLSLGIGLALVTVALNGLTDDLLFNIPSSMLLWMLAALAAALSLMAKQETAAGAGPAAGQAAGKGEA